MMSSKTSQQPLAREDEQRRQQPPPARQHPPQELRQLLCFPRSLCEHIVFSRFFELDAKYFRHFGAVPFRVGRKIFSTHFRVIRPRFFSRGSSCSNFRRLSIQRHRLLPAKPPMRSSRHNLRRCARIHRRTCCCATTTPATTWLPRGSATPWRRLPRNILVAMPTVFVCFILLAIDLLYVPLSLRCLRFLTVWLIHTARYVFVICAAVLSMFACASVCTMLRSFLFHPPCRCGRLRGLTPSASGSMASRTTSETGSCSGGKTSSILKSKSTAT